MPWHLAQANVARMRYALDAPEMAEFVKLLDEVNALADRSDGFVWRLKGSEGNYATDLQVYEDPRILFNMSVWTSVDALKTFTYRSQHGGVFKRRAEWFERQTEMTHAMWWIPAGTLPDAIEGRERIDHLRAHGESERAFSFRAPRPAPA